MGFFLALSLKAMLLLLLHLSLVLLQCVCTVLASSLFCIDSSLSLCSLALDHFALLCINVSDVSSPDP